MHLVPVRVKGRSGDHQASRLSYWCFLSFNQSICTCCCEEAASTYTKVSSYLKLCHSRGLRSSHSSRSQSSAETSNGLGVERTHPCSPAAMPPKEFVVTLTCWDPNCGSRALDGKVRDEYSPIHQEKNQRIDALRPTDSLAEWTGMENTCVPGLKALRFLLKFTVYMALTLRWGPTTKSPFTITSVNQFKIDLKAQEGPVRSFHPHLLLPRQC